MEHGRSWSPLVRSALVVLLLIVALGCSGDDDSGATETTGGEDAGGEGDEAPTGPGFVLLSAQEIDALLPDKTLEPTDTGVVQSDLAGPLTCWDREARVEDVLAEGIEVAEPTDISHVGVAVARYPMPSADEADAFMESVRTLDVPCEEADIANKLCPVDVTAPADVEVVAFAVTVQPEQECDQQGTGFLAGMGYVEAWALRNGEILQVRVNTAEFNDQTLFSVAEAAALTTAVLEAATA